MVEGYVTCGIAARKGVGIDAVLSSVGAEDKAEESLNFVPKLMRFGTYFPDKPAQHRLNRKDENL